MKEFHKENIKEEWCSLVEEFPEFIVDPSPVILEHFYDSVEKYPEYYKNFTSDDLINLRYGFECGVGWKTIIREYFSKIRSLIEKAKLNGHNVSYKTCILKEKFGELRDQGDFYGPDKAIYQDEYYELSINLQRKSSKICEVCGNKGELRNNSWLRTLCDDHANKSRFD